MSSTDDILFESECEDDVSELITTTVIMDNHVEKQDCLSRPEIPDSSGFTASELKHALGHIRACAQQHNKAVMLEDVAALLHVKYGNMLVVRHTPGGATPSQRMCHPAHNFLVLRPSGQEDELIVDINFRERFLLCRTTSAYEDILQLLPVVFVGCMSTLKTVLQIVCNAIAANFNHHGMSIPPWRTYSSLISLWDGTAQVDFTVDELQRMLEHRSGSMQSAFALVARKNVESCEVQPGQSVVPALVVVGFPADKCVVGFDTTTLSAKLAPKVMPPRITSQQLDKLLGPVHKVKLGRVHG